jgi:hypothetical protein
VPGSILGASRFSEMYWVWNGVHLSLVSTNEELLERKSSSSGLENQEYGRKDPLLWPRDTLYPQKVALTSLTSGGRSVRIVCLRTEATEFASFCLCP